MNNRTVKAGVFFFDGYHMQDSDGMTANAFLDDIQSALDSGMDAHVSKPIVLEQLKSTIQDVLERKMKL